MIQGHTNTTTIPPPIVFPQDNKQPWIIYAASGIALLAILLLLLCVFFRERCCPCFSSPCCRSSCCRGSDGGGDGAGGNNGAVVNSPTPRAVDNYVPKKRESQPENSATIIVHEPKSNSTEFSQRPEQRKLNEVMQTQRKVGQILASPSRRFMPPGSYQVARTAKIIGNILTTNDRRRK